MITTETLTIQLQEHETTRLPQALLPEDSGKELWRGYRKHLSLEFPSPKNDYNWELTPSGWAGFITIPGYLFELHPKVEIENLFRMLEYAYRLRSFHFSEGEVETDSLEGFFERLANLLARRILDRVNRGLYRSYVPKSKNLSFLRGRLDVRRSMRIPWDTKLHCYYTQHTTNNEDNQILAWTLQRITRNNIMAEKSLRLIHSVCRALQGIEIKSFHPRDCSRRIYNRLNEDYRQLHALCRFFLENSGPSHDIGNRKMLPFLVNMDRLPPPVTNAWSGRPLY